MKKIRFLILGSGLLASVGVGYVCTLPAQSKDGPKDAPRTMVANVSALGRLEPDGEIITLAAPTAMEGARVEKLLVRVGDRVEPGQILATLDLYQRRETAVQEANARVAVAQAKLKQVQAGAKPADIAAQEALVARAEADLKKADDDLDRAASLRGSGSLTKEELDTRVQQRAAAAQTLRHVREVLASLRDVRSVDIALAEAEVKAAQAGVLRAQSELDAAQVRALTAGQVIKLYAQPGERVGDKGILEMGNTATMYAVAEVYEADIPRVQKGQRARVRVAGIDGDLQGDVERVGLQVGRKVVLNNDPVADTDARVVEVHIKLNATASKKVAGLSNARVDVVVEVK